MKKVFRVVLQNCETVSFRIFSFKFCTFSSSFVPFIRVSYLLFKLCTFFRVQYFFIPLLTPTSTPSSYLLSSSSHTHQSPHTCHIIAQSSHTHLRHSLMTHTQHTYSPHTLTTHNHPVTTHAFTTHPLHTLTTQHTHHTLYSITTHLQLTHQSLTSSSPQKYQNQLRTQEEAPAFKRRQFL